MATWVNFQELRDALDFKTLLTDYGVEFAAIVQRGNFFGVQFHPERSAGAGRRLLANFLSLPAWS